MGFEARIKPSALDMVLLRVAPSWALSRMRARAAAGTLLRHYDAASTGRRTSGWTKSSGDANAVNGPAIATLRAHARDLVRNNAWARRALRVIGNNTVGWGIVPKAVGEVGDNFTAAWRRWSETTECDADRRLTFYGIQALALRSIVESGEVLIRRRRRLPEDGLAIPLQLQVLEADLLDSSKDLVQGPSGGPIVQGVEFDAIGRRVAYWLFEDHPGSARARALSSRRIAADQILHVYAQERPGQVRGVSWFAPAIVSLKDFDEFEDATLMRQKIAACFAAFVTDVDGTGTSLGQPDDPSASPGVDSIEPGMVSYLKPGQEVSFGTPPVAMDDGFTARTLRRVAAAIGVTYEDLTGDYSQVNYSSARMARLAHWSNVHDWRWNMLVPQLCDGIWGWATEAAQLGGLLKATVPATWTPPPMPMLDPDKEGLSLSRLVRSGAMTFDEMVREQGQDPESHWQEYAANLKKLDELGIQLDSDVRRVTQAGLAQQRAGAGGTAAAAEEPTSAPKQEDA